MKKLSVLVTIFTIMIGSVCFANQYDDKSDQYIKLDTTDNSIIYLNKSSVKSTQYKPPYYVIQCENIAFDEADNITAKSTTTFTYNSNTKNIQIQIPKSVAYSGDGSMSAISIQEVPPTDVSTDGLGFKEAIMLFKQIYGEKAANEFRDAPHPKKVAPTVADDIYPAGEMS